jgi:hypothetical protein
MADAFQAGIHVGKEWMTNGLEEGKWSRQEAENRLLEKIKELTGNGGFHSLYEEGFAQGAKDALGAN